LLADADTDGWTRTPRTPRYRTSIKHGLSNAIAESVNTKIRLIVRMAFGFHSADAIAALAMLSLGGHRPALLAR
jgi:transposase